MSDGEMVRWALVAVSGSAFATWTALCAVAVFRRFFPGTPKPSAFPSRALGLLDSHPYRALQTSQAPDVVAGCVALSDEAVRREPPRVLAIVRSARDGDGTRDGKRVANAIIGGIDGGT